MGTLQFSLRVGNALLTRPLPYRLCACTTALHGYICHKSATFNAVLPRPHVRGAKTVSKRKVKELKQGALSAITLPAQEPDDVPQYPPVIQGARDNIDKFNQCVVLTRVGNFYELYFEHAQEYSSALGLKLGQKKTAKGNVPMAGFPCWQLERFLKILVLDLDKHVAISEEFELSESERITSGGLYRRQVSRIITPGTLIDENFLDPYRHNYLLAMHVEDNLPATSTGQDAHTLSAESQIGLAWLDLSTGDFFTQKTSYALLPANLMRIGACEILMPGCTSTAIRNEIGVIMGHLHEMISIHDAGGPFESMLDWNHMLESPIDKSSESVFSTLEKQAGHRLLDYVRTRLQDSQLKLLPPRRKVTSDILSIDRGSLRGLEILETAKDGLGKGSLFHAVRRTVTKGGSRLLRERLTTPSACLTEIDDRLDLVARFNVDDELCDHLINCLKRTHDVQRLVQKFAMNKGDADDMLSLARAISATQDVCQWLEAGLRSPNENPSLRRMIERFNLLEPTKLSKRILDTIDEEGLEQKHRMDESEEQEVAEYVQQTIMKTAPEELASLPQKVRSRVRTSTARAHFEENEEPWIIRRSADETLESLHIDLEALKCSRDNLQERLKAELAGSRLELKWSPALGHICHISSAKPLIEAIVSTWNGRIISSTKSTRSVQVPEWSELGNQLAHARLKIRREETRIFRELRDEIIKNIVYLRRNAAVIDEIDVAVSFAVLAREQSWIRPRLNDSLTHKIVGGRHPTVKLGLEEQGRTFVSNDLFLGPKERIWLVTGPNMAGKSTFLRQNALITILAQVGSYVPADYAEIGLVDQIFSRIGAADDLFRDQSTFMVEMLETAAILKHATPKSFVIMDEVGRGTTPEDGTAVSFASLHHLYQINKSRTLFATHFHALVDMTQNWKQIGRYCTDVLEDDSGSFTFVHKLKPGVNRQSHALKVAKMAGLPESALDVAKKIHHQLMEEKHHSVNGDARCDNDYSVPKLVAASY